ncbi:MAG TPA: homoserine dehydrogenase [Thermoanaerobaculia bacterium]|nr:homoserine dehydrogenase [Thermoanaerobaculia bacterium]
MKRVAIALLGCGTVGSGFVELVERERSRIRSRFAVDLRITSILVRDLGKPRPPVDPRLLTTSAIEAIDAGADVVVELIGGVHSAGAYVRRALRHGAHVVTANKALLATSGSALLSLAAEQGVSIGFEASVCGCIPIVQVLREGLAGDAIEALGGVVNGTCNYILTRMEQGAGFEEALREAQQRGFAEADPSLDLDGTDAAQKMTILGQIAFGETVVRSRVRGIDALSAADIRSAQHRGAALRLVARAERVPGGVAIDVAPRELPAGHPFASVAAEENAVMIRGRAIGELLLRGKGAGAMPTAAAVLSDVLGTVRGRAGIPTAA